MAERILWVTAIVLAVLIGANLSPRMERFPEFLPKLRNDAVLTATTGAAAARQDLENGVRKVVLFGLLANMKLLEGKLHEFGYPTANVRQTPTDNIELAHGNSDSVRST